MRWGASAQTNREYDLVLDDREQFGAPLGLMLAGMSNLPVYNHDPETDNPISGRKRIIGKLVPADDENLQDDQSLVWTDWSLGMGFGRVEKSGRGGYSYGIGIDPRDPRRVLPAGLVTGLTMPTTGFNQAPIRGFQEFGSSVYAVTGPDSTAPSQTSTILRITDDEQVVVSGSYQSDSAPYFSGRSILQYRGNLYVGGYNGFLRRHMTTANVPDDGPLDGSWDSYSFQRVFLAKQNWRVAGIEDYYLLANDTDSTMVYTAGDPVTAGNWSSPTGVIQDDPTVLTHIGDNRYGIKSVGYSNHRIWWGKTDGVWDINSAGTASNATPFVEDALDDENCQSIFYHDGYLYFWTSMGFMRMQTSDRVRIDVPQNVQPNFGRSSSGPIFGTVTCNPTSDNGWLVVPFWNGTDSFLLYAQDPAALGLDLTIPLVWHGALAHFPGRKITALGKTALSGWPKLLIGLWDPATSTTTLSTMYMLKHGSAYQSWQHGDDYRFQETWQLYMTVDDMDVPNTRKALFRGDAVTENTSTARKIEVYNAIDGIVYPDTNSSGDVYYTLTPPLSGQYLLEIDNYGVTGLLDYDASDVAIQAALTAVTGMTSANVTVAPFGIQTYKITLIDLPSTSLLSAVGSASLAFHLQGTALTATRQAFVPGIATPTGFLIDTRLDAIGTTTEPTILTSLRWRLSLIEDQLEEKEYRARIGSGVTNREGVLDTEGDPQNRLSQLISYMRRGAISMVDESGRSIYGKVRSGMSYVKVEHDGGYYYEVTFKIKVQRQPFYWRSGATWSDYWSWS